MTIVAAVVLASWAAGGTALAQSGPPSPSPPAAAGPAAPVLQAGASGPDVQALQDQLSSLGYWMGEPDGTFGPTTEQAVLAVQKVAGLERTGIADAATRQAIDDGVAPQAQSTTGRVIEIDKARQVLLIVTDGQVNLTFNTSTGNEETYVSPQGGQSVAVTPTGQFRVNREIDGVRDGPLGTLYRPKYFNGGIAVHGSSSVPPYPASHGCVRVTNEAIDFIWDNEAAPIGTAVWVY